MNLQSNCKGIYPPLTTFLLVALAFLAAGCGKPATAENCERIVARITELELKEVRVVDDSEVKAQISQTQGAFKERMLTDCVGQRISASALTCVENATSARQIVADCFD